MALTPKDIDFSQLVADMATAGAFRSYSDVKPVSGEYGNPEFPGHSTYHNGPFIIDGFQENLEQGVINATHVSARQAIELYTPQETIARWMHQYFAKPFLRSQALKDGIKNDMSVFSDYQKHNNLPESLTLDLDNPKRKRTDRALYTEEEKKLTLRLCRQFPTLPLTILAYQAAFVDYFDKLHEAIKTSDALDPVEKEHGLDITTRFQEQWGGSNFIVTLLPGIALNYYRNHDHVISDPLTEKDFSDGVRFAYKNGMFNNNRPLDVETHGRNGAARFSCPARTKILQTTSLSLPSAAEPAQSQTPAGADMGTGLFHIYQSICESIGKKQHTALQAARDMNTAMAEIDSQMQHTGEHRR